MSKIEGKQPFNSLYTVLLGLVAIVVLLAVWQVRGILMLLFAAVMLSALASLPVRFFMGYGVNRGIAIFLSMASGVGIIILLSLLVFPTLITQFAVLFTDIIPSGINQIIEWWNSGEIYNQAPFLEEVLADVNLEIDGQLINQAIQQISQTVSRVGGSVIPLLGGVASAALSSLIVFFLCIYLIAQPDTYIDGIIALTPINYRSRMREILERIDETVDAWLKVTGVSMLFIGTGTGLGLAIIGVDQWVALGVLAGALSFIPNFGTVAALIPAVAVTIVQAPGSVFFVVFIIVAMSFIQAQIVGPILTAGTMNLPPVLVLIGQIVFGVFFGFLGIMLAVPLTAIVVVLVEEMYVKDFLGDTREDDTATYTEEDLVYAADD